MSTKAIIDSDNYSAFDHHVRNNKRICGQCFSRTHELIEERDPMMLKESLRGVLTDDVARTNNAVTDYHPSLPAANSRRTGCGECGSSDRGITHRPVSKDLAIIFARNLTERIEEIDGLSLDDDEDLTKEVEHLKSKKEYQKKDNHLYASAFDSVVSISE